MKLTDEQIKFVKENIKGKKVDEEKFLEYLEKNDSVGEEIFEECKAKDDHRFFCLIIYIWIEKECERISSSKNRGIYKENPFLLLPCG